MVIVKLMGGLGNQMFQYAAARRLAYVHDTTLKFDLSWFSNIAEGDTLRKYALSVFAIKENFAAPEEAENLKGNYGRGWHTLFGLYSGKPSGFLIQEKHYHFDPAILKLPDNVYLEGYWQSERYFSDIEDVIRKEFMVKIEPDPLNRQLSEAIKHSEAVSLHVRRGDFLKPNTNAFHGVCSLGYYQSAIDKIASQVQLPHFYVFSDEPRWVKENLDLAYPATFIDHNGSNKAYEDIKLMSLCKHHIIANSSFSWWGAWLNNNPEKTVIAPMKWFNKEDINTRDLIPETWIRM